MSTAFRAARPNGVIIVAQVWAMEWVARADTAGLTVIGMNHESVDAARRTSRYQRVKKYFPAVDRFLALTDEDADDWARCGMTNAAAMPNPAMIPPQPRSPLDRPRIVALTRLSHEKGIDMLVEAWALVANRHPHWRLDIYGSGPRENELRRQAETAGVTKSLRFRGRTSNLDAALGRASIFVLPSRQEGQPVSLMEAMAYGLPVVAFDCAPGVRDLLSGDLAECLVPPGNVKAFAAALERLMLDRERRERLSTLARHCLDRFAPVVVVDRWERLFQDLDRCRDSRPLSTAA